MLAGRVNCRSTVSLTRNYNAHTHIDVEENDQLAKCDKTYSRLDVEKKKERKMILIYI